MNRPKNHNIGVFLAGVAVAIGVLFIFLPPFNDWSWKTDSNLFNDYGSFAGAFFSLAAFFLLYATLRAQMKQYERDKFIAHFFELLKIHQRNAEVVANSEVETREADHEPTSDKSGFAYLADMIKREYGTREKKWVQNKNGEAYSKTLWDIIVNYLVEDDNLGLYFRHLFMLVQFVVQGGDKLLSYDEKRYYLSIVRALMSESEQMCLYYYWVSGYGSDWENDKNRLFTDYRMIYNINSAKLIPDFMVMKIPRLKTLLESNDYKKKKDGKDDYLFERKENGELPLCYQ